MSWEPSRSGGYYVFAGNGSLIHEIVQATFDCDGPQSSGRFHRVVEHQ